MTRDLNKLSLRELQLLSARVIATMDATSNNMWRFNKEAKYNSQQLYRVVIQWYIDEYGGWPDEIGPGKDVNLICK